MKKQPIVQKPAPRNARRAPSRGVLYALCALLLLLIGLGVFLLARGSGDTPAAIGTGPVAIEIRVKDYGVIQAELYPE